MKKNIRNAFYILPLLFGFMVATPAVAQQKGDYSPLVKQGYSDYKETYNPDTKVVYEGGDALLTTSHTDLSLERVKFFVPPGTKRFTVSFLTYLSPQEAKAAGRFGAVPTSTAADVTAATMIRNTANTLERLVAGEELPFYSPEGSGNLGISEPYQFDTFRVNNGGYVYLHVLSVPGGMVKTLQTRMVVDEVCYRSWYAHAQWDAQGNPDENATHTCAGSTGTTAPALTGITLSPTTWNGTTNAANTTVTVKPEPAGATLPTCTASPANLLTAGVASATQAQFSIIPTAVTAVNTKATINCGGKTASLTLQPANADVVQIKDNLPSVDLSGNLVLNFKLVRPAADIVGKTKTSFWLAARIPTDGFFFTQDQWFFLTPNAWEQMILPNPSLVAYKTNQTPKTETALVSPINLPKSLLTEFNVEIHFGYMDAEGGFKNMGIVWKKD